MDQLQQLVEYMASGLVDHPEAVHVDARRRGPLVDIHLQVGPDELGRVIGKGGRIAKAMAAPSTTTEARMVGSMIGKSAPSKPRKPPAIIAATKLVG